MQENNDQGKALKYVGNTGKQQKNEIISFPLKPIKIIVTIKINTCVQVTFFSKNSIIDNCLFEALGLRQNRPNSMPVAEE
jgi:hypothetical protein